MAEGVLVSSADTRTAGRLRRLGRRTVFGYPLWILLLWATAAAVLAACPMMLTDPAMWLYVADPELLALIVIIGVQYTRLEVALLAASVRAGLGSWAARVRRKR